MSTTLSSTARRCQRRQAEAILLFVRTFAVEHISSSTSTSHDPPPPPVKHPSIPGPSRPRTRLSPSPRHQLQSNQTNSLQFLPANFGQNQWLPVSNTTRALLESIVAQFNAPIRYAFAYGSGVFEQDGYVSQEEGGKKPMLDFMFAVRHPGHWHSINMAQFPGHYPLHARVLGSDFVSRVQEVNPGVWFNTHVKVKDVVSKCHRQSVFCDHKNRTKSNVDHQIRCHLRRQPLP
jgi:translocator assembly and maintenance protein 41